METNIMEHTNIKRENLIKVEFEFYPNKEAFQEKRPINLLDISNEDRKNYYLAKTKEFNKKESDFDFLVNKLKVVRAKTKVNSSDIEEINSLEGKIASISKTKARLEKEIQLICKANMILNLKEDTSTTSPIGGDDAKLKLAEIIQNHIEVFELAMYEQLCCNSTDVVLPVLSKILGHHGYQVRRMPIKQNKNENS